MNNFWIKKWWKELDNMQTIIGIMGIIGANMGTRTHNRLETQYILQLRAWHGHMIYLNVTRCKPAAYCKDNSTIIGFIIR